MAFKDISLGGNSTEKVENDEKVWNTQNSFESVGKEKLDSLKKSIVEIKELILEREGLSNELFDEGEQIKADITNFFVENPAGEQEVREKIALKQKQVEISELQLKEKVSCWQDVSVLKKELREKEKELAEKQGRMDMLGKILEEK
jgi:hypothetical protein